MNIQIFLGVILSFTFSCHSQPKNSRQAQAQTKHVGGPCQGCEAIFEYGDKALFSVDTLPDFDEHNPKLKLTGTVFQQDGRTPAEDIILYIHLTVKEPDKNEYYLSAFLFEDDSLLTKEVREEELNRGGSGIRLPQLEGSIYTIKRDLILGLNIPNY